MAEAKAVDVEQSVEMLRSMLEIRFFEDECQRMFTQGLVRGSTHLGQGQEAVAVGTARALRDGDTITSTYRGHAAALAMGAPLDAAFGEILGKAAGLCGGRAGSMHLADVSRGAIGAFAIVGAQLPVALGAAFASRYRESGAVAATFFGDGSTNIGAFHESLNMASIWKLPVVFVCENNLYGEYSPLARTTPIERLADRADSYAMAKMTIDGNDVLAVREAIGECVERCVEGGGPTLVEALTYRQKGHSRSDPATYRPEGELEEWLKRDPITIHEAALAAAGVESGAIEEVHNRAREAVAEALERAQSWPDPDPATHLDYVWSSEQDVTRTRS